jgi:hypothetical protein
MLEGHLRLDVIVIPCRTIVQRLSFQSFSVVAVLASFFSSTAQAVSMIEENMGPNLGMI